MERKVLGRGLEALIPADSQGIKERVQMLKVSQVEASRLQPRLNFSQERIQELANSIREKGVIQPVLVRAAGEDRYELIAGERRLRAVKHLGLTEIPAIVRRVTDADLLEMSLIENIQREELNPVEEAKAYRRLAQEFGLTQDTIAARVGKDKSSISNLLRILNLPDKIQDYLSKEFITFGHAKAILSLGDPKRQITFCEQIIERHLSVRQAEIGASQRLSPKRKAARAALTADSNLRDLEEKLQHALGTKVRLHHGKKRGKIEIEYYSLEDLDRVLALLGVK
ncbi:MAG: ParB/RepB/Spo0J family partition protein [Candidatus Omnitrophota bacterium]